jgi:transcriptional regulator with XRE-family HTH domain
MERIAASATTDEILAELGARLQRYRLQQDRTIQEVAATAGIGERTLERAEAGENPTLRTLVKVLRALGRVEALDAFLPSPLVSPLQLAAASGRERQRASGSGAPATRAQDDRG